MKTYACLFFLFFTLHTYAQQVSKGQVIDKETHEPLSSATVTLQREGKVINYALTDAEGHFLLSFSDAEGLTITVQYLGYKKQIRKVSGSEPMLFELESDAVLLKEVQIKPGRVWGRQDTLKYDLTRFVSNKDRTISDVLKKLPGINVEDNGTVKYNGRAISNLYVEGMDVSGGRYNQINNNLKADAVERAEVIEGHQPIKSLRNKVHTDDVALNLKLKPEVRSQWIHTLKVGGGYGEEALYDVSLNSLQLGHDRQTIYTYKANNTGKDLTGEQQLLAVGNSFDRVNDIALPSFLPLPSLSMPLSEKRLLFNDTHTVSANRLHRLTEDRQLRVQVDYTHDRTQREQGSEETYYFPEDTLYTCQNQHHRLQTNRFHAELNYEDNAATGYTHENFTLHGSGLKGNTLLTGNETLQQQIKNERWEAKNYFSRLFTCAGHTWGARSFIRYTHLPASLRLEYPTQLPLCHFYFPSCHSERSEESEYTRLRFTDSSHPLRMTNGRKEQMNATNAYTDNSLYWNRKHKGVNVQLTGGLSGELSSIKQTNTFKANRFTTYVVPRLEWESYNLLLTAQTAARWMRLPSLSFGRFTLNPSVYLRYKFSPRWKASFSGSLTHSEGGLTELYPETYRADYRTVMQGPNIVPQQTQQSYSLYGEYKHTIQEFFWTIQLNYLQTHRNLTSGRNYQEGLFYLSSVAQPHTARSYTGTTVLSKGIYDWKLKTSLEVLYSRNEGKQLNEGMVQSYWYDYWRIEPKINWSPSSFFEADYRAIASCSTSKIGESTKLSPLWNVSQRLTLNFGFPHVDLVLSAEHFYNDLNENQHLHTWLADVSCVYKSGKWRFTASLNNLFNQKYYRYTLYSAVQSVASWVKLRSREGLVTVQYQW